MENLSIFLILIIIVLIIIIFVISKTNKDRIKNLRYENIQQFQKYDSQISNIKGESQQALGSLKFSSDLALNNLNAEFEEYKRQVRKNFREAIPVGEIFLIEKFEELFNTPGFENCKIYGHLNFRDKELDKNYQADFLIVCNRGIFVLESKFWRGLTLIYSKWHNNLFKNTEFSDFGKGSGQEVTVFNVNSDDDKKDVLKISKYSNPITQARQYSVVLSKYLKREIKNIVVFQQDGSCQIKVDDNNLERYKIDEHTQITTQKNIVSLLQDFYPAVLKQMDIDNITGFIEKNFLYAMCFNAQNINQSPWGDSTN